MLSACFVCTVSGMLVCQHTPRPSCGRHWGARSCVESFSLFGCCEVGAQYRVTTTHSWRRRSTAEISMSPCWWMAVSWQPDSPIISLSASKYGSLHCSPEAGYRNHLDINYVGWSRWSLFTRWCCSLEDTRADRCILCMSACHLILKCEVNPGLFLEVCFF